MKISSVQALSEIILPPGSTSIDLQTAIDNAASGDAIIISGDMPFTDVVTIPAGKEITIRSDTGGNRVMSQPNAGIRHFTVAGILILRDITLDGMHKSDVNGGGGVSVNNGSLTINDGVVIQNCYFSTGGGVLINNSSEFIMTGGLIKGSIAGSYNGGGVGVNNSSTFTMSGGTISGNSANQTGGGVRLSSSSTFTMSGGTIDGNKANTAGGGGVFITGASIFTMSGGAISGNISNGAGGGISVSDGSLEITGESYIINNHSANNSGGGIYTNDSAYGNLRTSGSTVFNCNRASTAKKPPENAGALYPNIRFASTTITNHPLNNYDIFYWPGEVIDATFRITYNANGGIGSYTGSGIAPCETDTVLPVYITGIYRPDFTFVDWNTQPDGSGISYVSGDITTITSNITLYAQWRRNPAPKRMCRAPATKCRTSIAGYKLWVDDDNIGDTRPDNVEILLLRDEKVYDRKLINSQNDWAFGFCCLPVWKKTGLKYHYQIDEVVPDGYLKRIEGYNIINTLIP